MTAISQPPIDSDRRPPETAARPAPGTSLRDALLTIGALLGLLVLIELAVPVTSSVSAASILDGIAVMAYTVTGLIAWHRRPHNHIGRLMVATAVTLLAAGMADDVIEGLRTIGELLDSLPLAVLLHLLLAFPSGRVVGRAARWAVVAGYLVAIVLQIPQVLVSGRGAGGSRVECAGRPGAVCVGSSLRPDQQAAGDVAPGDPPTTRPVHRIRLCRHRPDRRLRCGTSPAARPRHHGTDHSCSGGCGLGAAGGLCRRNVGRRLRSRG